MTNEQLYMAVCKAYFLENTSKKELEIMYGNDLLKYKHETFNGGFKTFLSPMNAIDEIINTEIESQYKANLYDKRTS